MAGRTRADVGLGDLVHGDGRLHPDLHAALLQRILKGQGVDDGRKHAHVVRAGAFHLAAAVFDAAPEVAAADHDAEIPSLTFFGSNIVIPSIIFSLRLHKTNTF